MFNYLLIIELLNKYLQLKIPVASVLRLNANVSLQIM